MDDSDGLYEDYHDEKAPQYTKILDLTNGQGGELRAAKSQPPLPPHVPAPPVQQQAPRPHEEYHHQPSHQQLNAVAAAAASVEDEDMDDEDDEEEEEDEEIAMARAASDVPTSSAAHSSSGAVHGKTSGTGAGKLGGTNVNPNTPGKVVEAGQEQTGRWTKQEHEAFLSALRMYGKEWKKVAAKVKTRTVVQTRTHAQKYFQKLQKAQESSGGSATTEVDYVDMGIAGEGGGSSAQKPSSSSRPSGSSSHKKKHRQPQHPAAPGAATSAGVPAPPAGISIAKTNRRSSNATLSAAQVISNLSHAAAPPQSILTSVPSGAIQPQTMSSAASSFAAAAATRRPQHGFSTDDGAAPYIASSAPPAAGWASTSTTSSMKIVAPDPMATMNKGKFPEPSPAATGKRKLAEIAAARMLAGVAGVALPPPASVQEVSLQEMAMDDREGAATPPIEPHENGSGSGGLNMKDAPLPPLFSGSADAGGRKPPPLSLQIVNPESLGVTYEKKRKLTDGGSPVTPWESELEALVSEKARSETTSSSSVHSPVDNTTENSTHASTSLERKQHAVCGPGSAFGRSPLHRAVCELDIESLQVQLGQVANRSPGVLARLDEAGYAPLHTAASLRLMRPENSIVSMEMVKTLLNAGADPTTLDAEGNMPLHWAARAGDKDVAEVLLLRNSPLDAKNKQGETALHWGMRSGHTGRSVVAMLVENGARITNLNNKFKRPIDLAAEGFLDNEGSVAALKERDAADGHTKSNKMSRDLKKVYRERLEEIRETRVNCFARSTPSRTLLLHHRECLEHVPKSNSDWEAPDRVVSIMKRIAQPTELRDHEIVISSEFERANLDLLSRVHSTDYLHFVQNLSKDLEKQVKEQSFGSQGSGGGNGEDGENPVPPVVPFTPMVQRSMIKVSESAVKSIANSDTAFSAGSLRAARRAAGAVQHAVDCVLVGRNRNSFCVVRPPGHHAGVSGLLSGGESCGFCIFNNVAAGALYAISDERLLCERCAIVDIDVHHGNGTEEIVRKCSDPSKLFFFSIHLYDNDKRKRGNSQFQYKFYPGTGQEDDLAMNIINVPIVPLWKDQSAQSQPSGRTHNTRQKARGSDQEESPAGTPRGSTRSSDGGSESGSVNMPSPKQSAKSSGHSGRAAYREAIQNRLLPALRAFNPDLILISAGFDAAKGDVGNARHERGRERIGLDLEPEDYAWTTRKILEIADICCNGRVVSVLEGGYGRSPPAQQPPSPDAEVPIQPLDRSIFSECAVRHLHALVDPYDVERRFSPLN
mmetsp:Transcript_20977/g.43864  ORF Transcript_20977/g.43864 Transcript_20977/m.43864 type:complete len:1271 (-) Transcript_20977:79-3891(-)|eukprot:CAMPEP_0172458766 /NCGR_PEP_ID=MMETSP1065-20121228/29141_1 /TAXON_ID=265537 /ORGANISM="Amphiprora paludosa, Strain CCMP125" /LENGTH=1270 /DNA_ID=CAMNT_0013213169 /DNA_START=181 /DNA_END=3993 /DNA_ORIENTATION=-